MIATTRHHARCAERRVSLTSPHDRFSYLTNEYDKDATRIQDYQTVVDYSEIQPLIKKNAEYVEFVDAHGSDFVEFDKILTRFILAYNHDAGMTLLRYELTMYALPEEEDMCPMLRVEFPDAGSETPMTLRDAFLEGLKKWMASTIDTFERFKTLRAIERNYKFIFRRR